MSMSSREAQVLERQRQISMMRAASSSESNRLAKTATETSHAISEPRSLLRSSSSSREGTTNEDPIGIDLNHNNTALMPLKKFSGILNNSEPRANSIQKTLAQSRKRVTASSGTAIRSVSLQQAATATVADVSSKLQQPTSKFKRPSMNRNFNSTKPSEADTTTKQSFAKSNAAGEGSLATLLLSNRQTAKYLQPDAPKLMKAYPKIEPDFYWKNITEWDFIGELNEKFMNVNRNGQTKRKRKHVEGSDKNFDIEHNHDRKLHHESLPDTFQSYREYCALWAPLCLEEAKAQLISEAMTDAPYLRNNPEKCPLRVIIQPLSKNLEGLSERIGVQVKRILSPDFRDRQFYPNDIVALVKDESILWDAIKGTLDVKKGRKNISQSSSKIKSATQSFPLGLVGHIEHTRRSVEGLIIQVSKTLWSQMGTQEMMLFKIGSNVTSVREFTALCRMDRTPLLDYILCTKMNVPKNIPQDNVPKDEDFDSLEWEEKEKEKILDNMGGTASLRKGFVEYARNKFNVSQLEAISSSAQEYGDGGFTLIKGPPGTGKTTTLCAVLNALHIKQMNHYFDEVKVLAESLDAVVGKRASTYLSIASKKPRILVCAPSNAAVDNIILKIMEDGFIDGSGHRYNPLIVRIGSGQSASVKDVCLEEKVKSYLSDSMDLAKVENAIFGLKEECRKIHSDITILRQRMNAIKNAAPYPLSKDWEIRIDENINGPDSRVYFVNHKNKTTTYEVPLPPEPGERFYPARTMPEYKAFLGDTVQLVERYTKISLQIERYSLFRNATVESSGGRQADGKNNIRNQIETHILDNVHIVMTTLGTAGNRALEAANKFEVVVIDEAAQSVEPSTLAGLQLGSSHAILVGDPQQLPATIFSVSGRNTKYDRSLFQRLEEAGHAVHLLNTQYRMHPAISDFPRGIFYDGKLVDGPNVKHPEYGNPLKVAIFKKFQMFQPFTLLDLDSTEERSGTSLTNLVEAELALHLFNNLRTVTDSLSAKPRVAVITPYAQQATLLNRTFSSTLGSDYQRLVEINTVDAFQGREANIVIFSCVRAAGSDGIGFLSDVRRMNVALTRAKNFLFVIARCTSIMVNPYWRDLVHHARETQAVIKVPFHKSSPHNFTFPDLSTLATLVSDKTRKTLVHKGDNLDTSKKESGSTVSFMGLELTIPSSKAV